MMLPDDKKPLSVAVGNSTSAFASPSAGSVGGDESALQVTRGHGIVSVSVRKASPAGQGRAWRPAVVLKGHGS